MRRLTIEEVFKPGAKLEVKEVDFNDPEIIKAFEETKKRQEGIQELRDQPFENLIITI